MVRKTNREKVRAMSTVYADATARELAAQWQSPGSIGRVLAQLASTGQADAADLERDMWLTVREAQDVPGNYEVAMADMQAISEHITTED